MNERLKELVEQVDLLWSSRGEGWIADDEDLERLVELVEAAAVAREREACAKLCEGRFDEGLNFEGCAEAIRARGNTRTKTSSDICGND